MNKHTSVNLRREPTILEMMFAYGPYLLAVTFCALATTLITTAVVGRASADSFTDIFYTNSFRGAFSWIEKMDWVGMVVQCVISVFSLFGVALMTIRIMTSMLYLSAKGMWEEVHDLKNSGESEMYDFGIVNMAKSWAKGKAGTGLDAIIGAVLILLPDVKKYSDFGEKSGQKFDEDTTITQYILKIALPTIMTVFFFAMGFNGTLFQALAVTVDFMGTLADEAVSVNYAGYAQDLANSIKGYKFIFSSSGTKTGDLQQTVAQTLYGRCVSTVKNANSNQLYSIGQNVEAWVKENITPANAAESISVAENIKQGLRGEGENNAADQYMSYIGFELVVNGSESANGAISVKLSDLITGANSENGENMQLQAVEGAREEYAHIFLRQTKNFNGSYFNLDGVTSGVAE